MTKKKSNKPSAEKTIRNIRRNSRRQYSGEEKIRIVLEGLRGEESIAELCRREGISQSVYYRWSKEFLEAGKQSLPTAVSWARKSCGRMTYGAPMPALAMTPGLILARLASCWVMPVLPPLSAIWGCKLI